MADTAVSLKVQRRLQSRDIRISNSVRRMWELLSRRERRRLALLLPLLAINALLQVAGIASVMPFMSLAADPGIIEQQPYLAWAYDVLGFQTALAFTIATGALVLVVLALTSAFAAVTEYGLLRFSWGLNHSLSVRLLRAYLFKPYTFFLDHNSAELAKNTLGEVGYAVAHFVVAGMHLVARGVVAIAIVILLLAVEPLLSLATFGLLAGAYVLVFLALRRRLTELGDQRSNADGARFQAAAEALEGAKEIKLLGKEAPFLKRYERPSRLYVSALTQRQVVAMVPRHVMETMAFGAMLVIVLVFLARGQGIESILPTLGLFAFASYRLLPNLQSLFSSMTELRFALASVEILHGDLAGMSGVAPPGDEPKEALPVQHAIELRDVTFAYPNAEHHPVLNRFHVRIASNTSVAFVGATGAGKSTVVDLLLGLLQPQRGVLAVDDVIVDDSNVRAWQLNLGYVPQSIYLADDTVAANIAFGVTPTDMDLEAVERAARYANIHDFIVGELPAGYDTEIGERGVRLSGGQRQRLGIARALYRDPAVLFLDEATSALDNVTEGGIFDAVKSLGLSKTVVMVAHRISTIRDCDTIYVLDQGKIVAQGSYEELLRTSPTFRRLARYGNEGAEA